MKSGTIINVPLDPNQSQDKQVYMIQFDYGTSLSIPSQDMTSILPSAPVPLASPIKASDSLLPPFLQLKQKITYEADGQYFMGYMSRRNGIHRFSCKSHPNKRQEEWGVDLPAYLTCGAPLC